jgi:hypothetical protein
VVCEIDLPLPAVFAGEVELKDELILRQSGCLQELGMCTSNISLGFAVTPVCVVV